MPGPSYEPQLRKCRHTQASSRTSAFSNVRNHHTLDQQQVISTTIIQTTRGIRIVSQKTLELVSTDEQPAASGSANLTPLHEELWPSILEGQQSAPQVVFFRYYSGSVIIMLLQGASVHINEFLANQEMLICGLMSLYSHPNVGNDCQTCQNVPASYCCTECHLSQLQCRDCISQAHLHSPLHRIQKWNGSFFEPASLKQCSVIIYLGHNGSPCPECMVTKPWECVTVIHTTGI